MKRIILISAAIIMVGLISFGGFLGWRYLKPHFFKMASQTPKSWDGEVVLDDTVKAETPFAMISAKSPVGQPSGSMRSDYFRGTGNGMILVAASHRYPVGTPINTGYASGKVAEHFRSEQYAKKNGIGDLRVTERKLEVLGEPAYEIEISGSAKGVRFRNRIINFSRKATSYTMGLDAADATETSSIWNRIMESIRWVGPVDEFKEAPGLSTGNPGLPSGMKPRNLGSPN